jgi:hypothetical protein
MSSIENSFFGLISSLLLNLGLTRLAEKLDPMLRDAGAIRNMMDSRSSAFTETVCNFRSSAFTETVCNFRSVAFTETVCNFRSAAFTETVCNFTPQGS